MGVKDFQSVLNLASVLFNFHHTRYRPLPDPLPPPPNSSSTTSLHTHHRTNVPFNLSQSCIQSSAEEELSMHGGPHFRACLVSLGSETAPTFKLTDRDVRRRAQQHSFWARRHALEPARALFRTACITIKYA